MYNIFYDFTVNINKLNKSFLQMIDLELKRNKIYDVNPNQALLILNVSNNPKHITNMQEGYYLGTNISYNIDNLVKKGYVTRVIDKEDLRCAFIGLTEKGQQLYDILYSVFMSRLKTLQKVDADVKKINEILLSLQVIF